MDLVTLALATTLACQVPENDKVVGLWESTAVSRGGIGHNLEFREDGSYTSAVTVIVDLTYDIKDGSFYMSHNKDEQINYEKGKQIEITESGFTLTDENGEEEMKTKVTPGTEKTIVGKYKYRHYSGAIAYEKYTSDGIVKFRLPMNSVSGCYLLHKNTITITHSKKEPSEMTYEASDGLLNLKDLKGKHSYNLVPEGAWYQSKEIDYQKPTE